MSGPGVAMVACRDTLHCMVEESAPEGILNQVPLRPVHKVNTSLECHCGVWIIPRRVYSWLLPESMVT